MADERTATTEEGIAAYAFWMASKIGFFMGVFMMMSLASWTEMWVKFTPWNWVSKAYRVIQNPPGTGKPAVACWLVY